MKCVAPFTVRIPCLCYEADRDSPFVLEELERVIILLQLFFDILRKHCPPGSAFQLAGLWAHLLTASEWLCLDSSVSRVKALCVSLIRRNYQASKAANRSYLGHFQLLTIVILLFLFG